MAVHNIAAAVGTSTVMVPPTVTQNKHRNHHSRRPPVSGDGSGTGITGFVPVSEHKRDVTERRFPPPQYDFTSRDIRFMSADKHATQSRSCLTAASGWADITFFFPRCTATHDPSLYFPSRCNPRTRQCPSCRLNFSNAAKPRSQAKSRAFQTKPILSRRFLRSTDRQAQIWCRWRDWDLTAVGYSISAQHRINGISAL